MDWRTRTGAAALLALMLWTPGAAAEVVLPELPDDGDVTDADKEQARKAYAEASAAYSAERLEVALEAAERSWQALPNASTALIRATILGDLERHREAFEAYLLASDLAPTAEERELVDEGLARHGAEIEPPLGWVIVRTEPSGARVTVGDSTFRSPRTLAAGAGDLDLLVEAEGHAAARFTTRIRPGRETSFHVALSEASSAPPPAPAQEPSGEPGPSEPTEPSPAPLEPPPVERPTEPPPGPGGSSGRQEQGPDGSRSSDGAGARSGNTAGEAFHLRKQIRPHGRVAVGGSAYSSAGGTFDPETNGGAGVIIDFPFDIWMGLALRTAFSGWHSAGQASTGGGPNVYWDVALQLQGRVPIKNVLEFYYGVPVGLSIATLSTTSHDLTSSVDSPTATAGWMVGGVVGLKVFLARRFGIFFESAFLHHRWTFDDGLGELTYKLNRPTLDFGLVIGL